MRICVVSCFCRVVFEVRGVEDGLLGVEDDENLKKQPLSWMVYHYRASWLRAFLVSCRVVFTLCYS